MSIIINLTAIIDYSFEGTIAACLRLCSTYDKSWQGYMPSFFQNSINRYHFKFIFEATQAANVSPYKLGYYTTNHFLNYLAVDIFSFMKYMDIAEQRKLQTEAWNASITLSEEKKGRFELLLKEAQKEPVYLISNTDELHMTAIIGLLKTNFPDVKFNENIDISVESDPKPVELAPNIFVCLSYRYNTLTTKHDRENKSIIQELAPTISKPITLVSQYTEERLEAVQVGITNPFDEDSYFRSLVPNANELKFMVI